MKAIIAIIALSLFLSGCGPAAYYGVSSPDKFLPEKCTTSGDIICLDFTAAVDGISLVLMNRENYDLADVEITLNPRDGAPVNCLPKGDNVMSGGEQDVFTCNGPFEAGRLDGTLDIKYTNTGNGLAQWKSGSIVVKIE
jgi:hypothetical protein